MCGQDGGDGGGGSGGGGGVGGCGSGGGGGAGAGTQQIVFHNLFSYSTTPSSSSPSSISENGSFSCCLQVKIPACT